MSQNTRSKTTPKSSRSTTPTNTNNLTADQTIIDHTSQTTNHTRKQYQHIHRFYRRRTRRRYESYITTITSYYRTQC